MNITNTELRQMKALQDTERETKRADLDHKNKLAANVMLARMLGMVQAGESSLVSEVAEVSVGVSIYE